MTTLVNNNNENNNAANVASNNEKINDFGQKIGGARKDMYQAAREWAAMLADITADKLAAVGLSKLVRLPNLEKMTEAGAITPEQARAALIVWRTIDRKPANSWQATAWANKTRDKLGTVADILTGEADGIPADVTEAAEYQVLTAAGWPAVPFSFGKYLVIWSTYIQPRRLRITSGRWYVGESSEDPANIAQQLREMVAKDEENASKRRAAGPALGVYCNRAGLYYIAPANRSEIVLNTYESRADAVRAYKENRAELLARYETLKTFPACRRDWNRPRVGEDWRKGENMTPEEFAAVLPFRGVEFGNWVNQTERAALLNSAFDGFHDLAAVLNIAPAAVTLGGSLAFAFASRGHSGAAAHYEPGRRVINLTKKSGAGCMAHEWWHAVDNFAAGGGPHNYATERADFPKASAILRAIKQTAYYKRSQNLAAFGGSYWVEGRELTARAFEGVCAVMLNAAGICSDFLVNCKSMDDFTAEDVAHRSDCYPYPTAQEAAALLPLYVDFLREVFGQDLTAPAAALATAEKAAKIAEAERIEAERIARERAEALKAQREQERQQRQEEAARKAAETERRAEGARAAVVELLTARGFDTVAINFDSVAVYAVGHLSGELYTLTADIKTTETEGRAYLEALPMACASYKYIHNAKRIIIHRYLVPQVRSHRRTARELVELMQSDGVSVRDVATMLRNFEKVENIEKAARVYAEQQQKQQRRQKPAAAADGTTAKPERRKAASDRENGAPAEGLQLVEIAGGVAVVADDWKTTYFNKGYIKANGAHWVKDAKQWQATEPADVARLRAWFALRDGEQTAQEEQQPAAVVKTEPAAVAEQQPAAVAAEQLPELPEWLTVGAEVMTAGRFMINGRTMRPEWVAGERMTVTAITPDFVSLKSATAFDSIRTATAADELTPVATEPATAPAAEVETVPAAEVVETEPAEVAASYDTDQAPAAAGPCYSSSEKSQAAPVFISSATESEKAAAPADWMHRAGVLDKIVFNIVAPWCKSGKWLCPYFGARSVLAEHLGKRYADSAAAFELWSLTAHVGDSATFDGLTLTVVERGDDPEPVGGGEAVASYDTTETAHASTINAQALHDFKTAHDLYNRRRLNGWTAEQLRQQYTRDALAVHALLECEVFYIKTPATTAQALDRLRASYPESSPADLDRVYYQYQTTVAAIYG